jgi:hypothetical protein
MGNTNFPSGGPQPGTFRLSAKENFSKQIVCKIRSNTYLCNPERKNGSGASILETATLKNIPQ